MYEIADVYRGLRGRVLEINPVDVGLEPGDDPNAVWGALMDIGYESAIATLMGLSDGTTSIYFSNGGGMIGGGPHATVNAATKQWLQLARRLLDRLEPATEFPLPEPQHVCFAVFTYGGSYAGVGSDSDLGGASHPLSPLFIAGHDVITQFRLVTEQQRAQEG